ncbi:hemerythrin domain-containing protein [Actinocorallia sp. B10E7]|uniref:hemerythrin domain-containing protein n=1 Tax=Actinocorallia sp. B10E7 TaxID=3153558 RepID=UPI00325D9C82
MGEGEKNRLIAWNRELQAAHQRLRQALRLARDSLAAGDTASARADLLLYCKGFCTALDGHHTSEDVGLFPELSARYPVLRPTIAKLEQDHEMLASLLGQFDRALTSAAPASELSFHLDGLSAIMESHFQYEERQLLGILSTLELDADPRDLLGPL